MFQEEEAELHQTSTGGADDLDWEQKEGPSPAHQHVSSRGQRVRGLSVHSLKIPLEAEVQVDEDHLRPLDVERLSSVLVDSSLEHH